MLDSQRFDSLTKQMITGVTRRRMAKTLLGGAVVGALTQLGSRASAAQSIGHCCAVACRGMNKHNRFCFETCRDSPVTLECD